MQRARDVLADIVGVHGRLDLDLIGNPDDADQGPDRLRRGFLLELPVAEIGIPFDNVRATDIAQPQRWRMQDIVRFAGVMGPLSSVFDLVTFGTLFIWFQTGPEVFRTGWFVESIATQTLVIFIIRTHGRPWRDLPNAVLTITTLAALAVALGPFSPLGEWFGFSRRRRPSWSRWPECSSPSRLRGTVQTARDNGRLAAVAA